VQRVLEERIEETRVRATTIHLKVLLGARKNCVELLDHAAACQKTDCGIPTGGVWGTAKELSISARHDRIPVLLAIQNRLDYL